MDKLEIRGAREHNLKNISLDIPRTTLTVITGLSGSGKSSLAFDTIYAEGQRRYVESLSAYARQFLELTQKPDVDSIEGLSPAISIEQKTTSRNPRSTVGTVTEIYDYMRLPGRGSAFPIPRPRLPIESQTVGQMVDRLMTLAMENGSICWLHRSWTQGRIPKRTARSYQTGIPTVKVDGTLYEIDDVPALNKKVKHDIEVVVDRVVINEGLETRLADSLETALRLADDLALPRTRIAGNAGPSRLNSPARSPASPSMKSSHGCSASTTSEPVRPAAAWARKCFSIRNWWFPTIA